MTSLSVEPQTFHGFDHFNQAVGRSSLLFPVSTTTEQLTFLLSSLLFHLFCNFVLHLKKKKNLFYYK